MSIANTGNQCDLSAEVVDNIQKLHQANIDSVEGFREAADSISDSKLAVEFRKWARERHQQASELAKIVECSGDVVDRESSWLADLHRAYMSLRTALSSDDKYAILAEAERGEDQIKQAYEDVLKDTPGSAVNDVLQKQYAQVKATHDQVRDLRDACKNN